MRVAAGNQCCYVRAHTSVNDVACATIMASLPRVVISALRCRHKLIAYLAVACGSVSRFGGDAAVGKR